MQEYSCTVIKDNITYRSTLSGIRPLMNWLTSQPEILENSYVIDKVVGKASALLLTYGKAQKIHGLTMSKAGHEILERYGIEHSWDVMVDYIQNMDHTDMCPMEKKVINIDDPKEAYQTFLTVFTKKQ